MKKLAFAFILLLATIPAFADVTGVWSGTYSAAIACHDGSSVPTQGAAIASLSQSGSTVNGAVTLQGFTYRDNTTCTAGAPADIEASLSGTLNGSAFSGTLALPNKSIPITGSMTDSSISLSISDANGSTGSINLTPANNLPPPQINVGGTWSGVENLVAFCGQQPVQATGTMTLVLTQTGNRLSGTVTFDKQFVNCSPVGGASDTVTGFVYGQDFSLIINDPQQGVASGGGAIQSGQLVFAVAWQTGTQAETVLEGILNQTAQGAPVIASFSATPSAINPGTSTTLSWSTIGATSVSIDNGVGAQGASGSVTVAPTATTTYTLTATGPSGTATSSTTVTVGNTTPPAAIDIGKFPTGMLQPTGIGGATDRYTIVNNGGTAATMTLSQTGSFFTQSPTSFTIAPGGSQTVLITASAQPAGSYDGESIVSGGGANIHVPIGLVVAAPPSGSVTPAVVGNVRLETSGDPTQTQASGSIPFKNSGSDTLQGIAAADVPWLIPQEGIITIPAGQTQNISYTIDRTKRPDASSLLGGQTGTITLKYLRGASGKGLTALDATSSTSSVSVTLVDVVKPGVSAGTPAPLNPGEVALFVPGISSKTNATGDLLLANRGNAPIADLKVFYGNAGVPATQVTALGSLASNAGIAFPAVVRTVFGANGQTGALQLRSSNVANVSVATVQVNTATSTTYATALPILRSDRGVSNGGALYLVGVAKSDHQKTNLELQEMSGASATANTDFVDATGNVIGSRSDALQPFAFLELQDVVPAGAVTARVRNNGSGVLGGYAMVVDTLTNDAKVVTDLATPSADTFFAPIVPGPNGSSSVSFTNASGSPATVNAAILTTAAHHHSAAHATPGTGAGQQTTFNVGPLAAFSIPASNYGFIKLTAPAGALHGSAQFASNVSGTPDSFGSGVPLFSSAAALASGSSKRFAGVEDASAATVAKATPATYRANLMLIETSGQSATVQVTLRFNFVSGALTATQVTTSKNFDVPAGSFLLVSDLARSVIGAQRDAIGDLHNVQVDVSVVGGNGKVIPVVEQIDNASGDVTVRAD